MHLAYAADFFVSAPKTLLHFRELKADRLQKILRLAWQTGISRPPEGGNGLIDPHASAARGEGHGVW